MKRCEYCKGTGEGPDDELCPVCNGYGTEPEDNPELEKLKKALDLAWADFDELLAWDDFSELLKQTSVARDKALDIENQIEELLSKRS